MSSSSLSRLTPVNLLISEPAEGSAASAALDLDPAPTFGPASLLVFTPSALLDLRKRFPLGLCSPLDCGDSLTDWAAAAGGAGATGVGDVPRSEAGFSSCPTCLRLRMRLSMSASRLRAAVWEPRRWGGGGCSIWLLLTSWLLLLLTAAAGGAFFFKNLLPPPRSPPIELWGRRSWRKTRISITRKRHLGFTTSNRRCLPLGNLPPVPGSSQQLQALPLSWPRTGHWHRTVKCVYSRERTWLLQTHPRRSTGSETETSSRRNTALISSPPLWFQSLKTHGVFPCAGRGALHRLAVSSAVPLGGQQCLSPVQSSAPTASSPHLLL